MKQSLSIFKIDPVWGVWGLLTCLYLSKMAPEVVWKDSGEMIAASHTLGVPHGSGYVLFVQAAKVLSLIPLGSVATRVGLLNVVGATALLVLLTLMIVRLGEGRLPGHQARTIFAGTLVLWLGTRRTFVSEAGGTENSLIFFFLLVGAIYFMTMDTDAVPRRRSLAFVLMGLAGSYHPSALLGLPLLALDARSAGTGWRSVARCVGLGVLAAIAPLLFVIVRSGAGAAFEIGDRSTLAGWWQSWLEYGRINQVVWPGWDLLDWLRIFKSYLSEFFPGPFLWIVAALALGGVSDIRKLGRWALALVFGLLAASATGLLVNAGQERLGQSLMFPLLILVLAGRGFFRLAAFTVSHQHRVMIGTAAVMALPAVLAMARPSHLQATSESARRYAERLAMETLPGGVLVVPTSQAHFVLSEIQTVENRRPDLTVVNESFLSLRWYGRQVIGGEASHGSRRDPLLPQVIARYLHSRPVHLNSIASISKLAGLGYVPQFRRDLADFSFLAHGLTFQVVRVPEHDNERPDPKAAMGEGQGGGERMQDLTPVPPADAESIGLWRSAFLNLAAFYERSGETKLQEAYLLRAAEVDPNDRMARFALERLLKKRGQTRKTGFPPESTP